MLAQNFKTANELQITEPQLSALIKTLVLFETGKIKYVPVSPDDFCPDDDNRKFSGHFNMVAWSMKHPCGTVACIGGTAEMVGGVDFQLLETNDELDKLFYPEPYSYGGVTVEQAARALRNYLTFGEPRWKEVLGY